MAEFDTATLFEAAGQTGAVDPRIRPAWPGARLCGRAFTVSCPPGDNLMLHHAVAAAGPGDVLVASVNNFMHAGAWGEVLTVAAQARGVAGLAIDGAIRDTSAIARRGFPVFSRGVSIASCTKQRPGSINQPIVFGGILVRPGDILVADADGIVVIDQEKASQVLAAADRRRMREAAIMAQLTGGKTTLELLDLPPLDGKAEEAHGD